MAKTKHADPVVEQLEQIKRLMMLQLLASDVEAQTIGKVLGLTKSQMSDIIPARTVMKSLKKRSE